MALNERRHPLLDAFLKNLIKGFLLPHDGNLLIKRFGIGF